MKKGDKIDCPHCGEKSFVREKRSFDEDFSLKSSFFCCALCGAPLEPGEEETTSDPQTAGAARLAAFLGGETVRKSRFAPDEDDGKVCLHCRHYIKHPFMDRCGITLKQIDVMDSCEKFAPGRE